MHHIRIFDYNEKLYVIVILKYSKIEVIINLKICDLRTRCNITMLHIHEIVFKIIILKLLEADEI
ncbi:hypothetical protein CN307_13695 [Bacillus cereus]|uniref:Uncharacterized protein n=1 Tax=Bacillus cereus TaxID=1396 RepID=A0A2A9A0Q7_BACCE|nr:hypothetical protein CN307_13695 [Bacillus cereus]